MTFEWIGNSKFWQTEDFYSGKCQSNDVGLMRPEYLPRKRTLQSKNIVTSDVTIIPTVDECYTGWMEAYAKMGGAESLAEWGRDHPTEFYKLFSRMLASRVTPPQAAAPTLVINLGGDMGRIINGRTLESEP